MPEAVITKRTIIVVNEVGTNQYGDLTWTDKDGNPYKVKSTRKQYFEAIVPNQAVEISWASYKGTEYPYSVIAIVGKLPDKPPEAPEPKTRATERAVDNKPSEMSKGDWAEKDKLTRKSIERQKSLELAVEIAKQVGGEVATEKIIATAKLFEAYLEGKEVQPAKSHLVEEAKKLGAEEITKGD